MTCATPCPAWHNDEVTASSQDGLQVLAASSLPMQDLATLRGPKIPLRLAWFKGESMQKRLLGAASLVGVAALLISACGGSSPTPAATGDVAATTTPAASSTTTGAPVRDANVDLVIWSDDDRAKILKKYADQFGQEQGIKVQIQVSTDVRKDFKAATEVGK